MADGGEKVAEARARSIPSGFDGWCTAVVIAVSTLPYVHRLGFASDDWAFVSTMALADDQSPIGLWTLMAEEPGLVSRPSQSVLQVVLFSLFGTSPLGYHLAGAVLLVAAAVLLHRVLVEIGAPRIVAFLVPVVWGLSPAYATARFWFSAFGYPLAMAAAFLSVWADLRAVRSRSIAWRWKTVALLALAVSALSMEVAVALLAAAPVLLAWIVRRRHGTGLLATYGPRGAALVGSTYLVLAAAMVLKASASVGLGPDHDLLGHLRRLVVTATGVQLGSFGALLPDSTAWATGRASLGSVVTAVLIGAGVATFTAASLLDAAPGRRGWLRVIAGGAAVFVLGWAVFLTTGRFTMTSTGIGNRVGIAGAVGAAAMLIGSIGLVTTVTRRPSQRATVGAVLAGGLSGAYALITLAISTHWVEARHQADHGVDVVAQQMEGRPGATVLVAGVCPYEGPAVVFESNWDLQGALRLRLGDPEIEADVVSPTLELGTRGFRTTLYGSIVESYRYGSDTLLVSYPSGDVTALTDQRTAIEALDAAAFDPAADCPRGAEGHGVTQLRLDDRLVRYRL